MIRKILAALAISAAALVALSTPALAAPGDAATPAVQPITSQQVIQVLPTHRVVPTKSVQVKGESSSIAPSTSKQAIAVLPTNQHLSYTGVSFNVPLTITIAALVVLAGFALIFFGGRGLARGTRRVH